MRNIFANHLEGAPFSEAVKRDLMKWRTTTGGNEELRRHLDTITYKQYMEGELGLSPEVTKFVEPVVGLICGASPDAVCARAGHNLVIPMTRGRDLVSGRQYYVRPASGALADSRFDAGGPEFRRRAEHSGRF